MEQLAFQINGEYLDLKPNTQLELEEENPFLQLDDAVIGPYSFPFEVPNTAKNLRLLGYHSSIATRKTPTINNVICWENGIQHSIGTLRVEQVNGSINDLLSGTTSLYYLTGSSSFWSLVEKKKLNELDFGGERVFDQPNTNITGGWWGHMHQVMQGNSDQFDYAFFPVKNRGIQTASGSLSAEWMNKITVVAGQTRMSETTSELAQNAIFPFPYLVYVMRRVFEGLGWKIDGNFFSHADIKKITLLSFRDIDYGYKFVHFPLKRKDPVRFDLADYMPPVEVGKFLIAIKNRLGLFYDFNIRTKVVTVTYLKDVVQQQIEDITEYATAPYANKLEAAPKVYRMTNDFDSGDSLPVKGDLVGKEYLGAFPFVPPFAAAEINEGKIYLRLSENAYYTCSENADIPGLYEWIKYMDNIYDYDPGGGTEDITSSATTTTMARFTDANFDMLVPEVNQSGTWTLRNNNEPDWGVRLLFFHGMQPDYNGRLYPYASNHPMNCAGQQLTQFALTYYYQTPDGPNGLYHYFWKPFLDYLKQPETLTVDVNYPFSQKGKLRFGSAKVIQHTKFFVKKKTTILPYNGVVKLELIKV